VTFTAIVTSDLHLSNRLQFAKPTENGRTDRLDDQLALLDSIKTEAKKADAVIIAGDLFDQSRVDAVTLTETTGGLRKISEAAPLFIMAGNHDAVNITGGRFTVEAYGAMRSANIRYISSNKAGTGLHMNDWLRFWPIEFCPIPETQLKLDQARAKMKAERMGVEVALLHNSIMGCGHEGWLCDDGLTPEEATEGFDFTIAGHFHTPQDFAGGKGMYCGAPLHFRFDDANRKAGFWRIEFESDGTIRRHFIDSGLPRFYAETWEAAQLRMKGHAGRLIGPGDYYRVEVSATHAEWTKIKPAVFEYVERMKAAKIRCSFKHKPLYHHTERLQASKSSKKRIRPIEMIDEYVDAANVDTSGLDSALLKRIGRKALERAAAARAAK
jgi:DNA repair exonuclease SbcCD nuclease subunit